MPPARQDAPLDDKSAEVKGTMVRGLAAVLADRRLLEAVGDRVSPAARALLLDPPVGTAWIDARLINELHEAVRLSEGDEQLRRINREAVERGVGPLVKAAAESLLRVFGVTPAALLSRLDRVAGTTGRGVVYRYAPIDDTSGHFEIEFPGLQGVPLGPFIATAGALEAIFPLCGARGTIDQPEVVPNGRRNCVRFAVSWRIVTRK